MLGRSNSIIGIVNRNKRQVKDGPTSKTLPGSAGWLWSDQSLRFYQDALSFVEAGIKQHKSRIFLTRLFLKPCVIVADNEVLRELLTGRFFGKFSTCGVILTVLLFLYVYCLKFTGSLISVIDFNTR